MRPIVRHPSPRLDFRRSLVSLLPGKECGLLSRTEAGNRAYSFPFRHKKEKPSFPPFFVIIDCNPRYLSIYFRFEYVLCFSFFKGTVSHRDRIWRERWKKLTNIIFGVNWWHYKPLWRDPSTEQREAWFRTGQPYQEWCSEFPQRQRGLSL